MQFSSSAPLINLNPILPSVPKRFCWPPINMIADRFRYECVCPGGFVGLNCDENYNECESNPCLHGGYCDDRVNGYQCRCR